MPMMEKSLERMAEKAETMTFGSRMRDVGVKLAQPQEQYVDLVHAVMTEGDQARKEEIEGLLSKIADLNEVAYSLVPYGFTEIDQEPVELDTKVPF